MTQFYTNLAHRYYYSAREYAFVYNVNPQQNHGYSRNNIYRNRGNHRIIFRNPNTHFGFQGIPYLGIGIDQVTISGPL